MKAKEKKKRRAPLAIKAALEDFVNDVESTGGIRKNASGYLAPIGDPDWSDLAYSYLKACKALGVRPVVDEGD